MVTQLTTNINEISQRTFPRLNLTTKQWRTVSMYCVIEALTTKQWRTVSMSCVIEALPL